MVSDGFDDGSNDVLLFAVGKEEMEAGGEAVDVGDGGEEVEGAVQGLEAQSSGGAFGEGVGEAGEDACVTEILAEPDGDVVRADELHREVDGEAGQPVKEGADGRHGSGTSDLMRHGIPGEARAIYNLRGSQEGFRKRMEEGLCVLRSRSPVAEKLIRPRVRCRFRVQKRCRRLRVRRRPERFG